MSYRAAITVATILGAALTGCVGDDVWQDGIPDGGSVITEPCNAGDKKCEADTLKTCNSAGTRWIVENCVNAGAKCLVIGGVAQCKTVLCQPDNVSCAKDGLTTRTCAKDGNSWVNGQVCNHKAGQICYGGVCQSACKIEARSKQNVGCTFYPVNLDNQKQDKVGVVVSNPNKWPALVTLTDAQSQLDSRPVQPGKLEIFIILTVTPKVSTAPGGGIPALSPGQPYTTTLGEMDVLQLATKTKGQDMTGTKVEATRPVAVFGGNSCANLPQNKTFCDHVQEQMFPVETWGKGYLAVKFMPRGQTPEDDWWRIMASEPGTKVTLSGAAGLPTVPTLGAGQHFQINTPQAFVVQANKPISIGHYLLGQGAVSKPLNKTLYSEPFQTPKNCAMSGPAMGDPAISVSVPFEQYRKQYIFLTPDTYRYDFVTVMVPSKKETPQVMIDGKPIPVPLQKIGNTDFRFARFRVSDGPHTMSGTTPFGIEVHGYDCNVSYAYSGGLSLKVINPIK